jgi:hypothetical protein
MANSPVPWVPLDPAEQPVLDKLLEARTQLELLKQDRSTYVKSCDVSKCYRAVVEQVGILNGIREKKPIEQNKLDLVLDDCFQLISLAYLTMGKTQEAPAVYSAISTIRRLLDHLREAAFFSPKDLQSIRGKLQEYREVIERGKDSYCPHLMTLLNTRLQICHESLAHLEHLLAPLTPELSPTYEKLVSISRCLSSCNLKPKFPTGEVNELHGQIKEIAASLDAKLASGGDDVTEDQLWESLREHEQSYKENPTGRTIVMHLLTRCMLWVKIMRRRQGKIDGRFKHIYDELMAIRNSLEKLHLTRAWSLRETDLYSYQRQLDRIDGARVDGNFLDELGRPAELYEQRTMLHLIRKSYALIYLLIISSEPVSEALMPVYNQLLTLRKCMLRVKEDGTVLSPRELYPYTMKLASIDKMRVDGKFKIGDDFPEGQESANRVLEDCIEIIKQLRSSAVASGRENGDSEVHAPDTVAIES